MPDRIRVQLPDADSATSLTQELFGQFRCELVRAEDSWRVEIPEAASTHCAPQVLSAIERWIEMYGLDQVTVHLGGKAHTLAAREQRAL